MLENLQIALEKLRDNVVNQSKKNLQGAKKISSGALYNSIRGGEVKVARAIEVYNKYFSATPSDDISNYYIDEFLY